MGHFMFISSHSRGGKSHVRQAMFGFRSVKELPIGTSREKKLHEVEGVDGFFMTREQIEAKKKDLNAIVQRTKNNFTCIDLQRVLDIVAEPKTDGIMIVPPELGAEISKHKLVEGNPKISTVLLSPITVGEAEIILNHGGIQALQEYIASIVRARTEAIAVQRKQVLTEEQIEKRVKNWIPSVMSSLSCAPSFKFVVPSPWSGHPFWQLSPIETAAVTVNSVYRIYKGNVPSDAEFAKKWPAINLA